VEGEEYQRFGNPQLLRRALDQGVKVIVAHCASLGSNFDLDFPVETRRNVSNFRLFMRMMENPAWEGLLFGDISAVVLNTRIDCLQELLTSQHLHSRLVNGSDYPLIAAQVLISTRFHQYKGLITYAERIALNEIYNFNPILFELSLKRCLKGPNGEKFPKSTFLMNSNLPLFVGN